MSNENIINIIDNAEISEEATILWPIWTANEEFWNDEMGIHGMISDMGEPGNLIAALYYAAKNEIETPKLRAEIVEGDERMFDPETDGIDDPEIKVTIESYVPEEFTKLYDGVMDGTIGNLKLITKSGNVTWIYNSDEMNRFHLNPKDIVEVINQTL